MMTLTIRFGAHLRLVICLALAACGSSGNGAEPSLSGSNPSSGGTGGSTAPSSLPRIGGSVGTGGILGAGAGATGIGGGAGAAGFSTSETSVVASAGKGGTSSNAIGTSGGNGGGGGISARKIAARGFTFDALETASSGEPVLLLHGFPDTSLEWTALMPVLAANGYHCLAPDQRGYSPGARPTEVDAYKYEELVADAFAIGSELGEKFHIVAHDWGANVAWLMLKKDPSRIASFTAISVPHYRVWARAVYDAPEMAGYLSMLSTWITPGKGEASWTAQAMRNMWTAKPAAQREETIAHMTEPGVMTAALNWYRASNGHKSVIDDFAPWEVKVPTLLIFGSDDIGQATVIDTKPLMTGFFRVVQPKGAHFIVDEQPQVVSDEVLAHLQAFPIR